MTSHIIIKAGAGTGKTFTVTEGVHAMTYSSKFNYARGSVEQQAVWDVMRRDEYPGNIHMTSFTTDASEQLADKCPTGAATSSSTYGIGLRFAKKAGHAGYIDRWGHKYKTLTTEFLGCTRWESNEKRPGLWDAIFEVQGVARLQLKKKLTPEEWRKLADHFGVGWEGGWLEDAVDGTNAVLKAGLELTGKYDFTDMVYIPVLYGLITKIFDTLIVDEFQDMGRAQQEVCLLSSWKRILIGDPHQAIYGFAGADQNAFDRLEKYLGDTLLGVTTLPLTVSRRCCQAVVREANKIVPELRAMDNAPEGKVIEHCSKEQFVQEHLDRLISQRTGLGAPPIMIICPTNAPLIGLMFKLKKRGINSYVQGKDVTASMVNFVERCDDMNKLLYALEEKLCQLERRKQSRNRDTELDKMKALMEISQECLSKGDVIKSINNMFSDTPVNGWLPLRSVHKSKGLEGKNVVFWEEDRCNSPQSTLPWQHAQDRNLRYVGTTRAKLELIKVQSK